MKSLILLLLIGTPAFAFVEDGGFLPKPFSAQQIRDTVVKSLSIANNAKNDLEGNRVADGN